MSGMKLDLVPVTDPSPQAPPRSAPQEPAVAAVPAPAAPARARGRVGASKPSERPRREKPDGGPWREWGPFHATVSYKLPPELVAELDDRLHRLREHGAKGLAVAAALTELLDLDDDELRARIERAEACKPRRRRG